MMRRAVGVLILGGLAGCGDCGGDDDTTVDAGVDAAIDAGTACDVLAPPGQQGCSPGQKCTWIVIGATPAADRVDCVPDGTVSRGGACQRGPDGETTGFDDCTAGNICIAGICQDVCGFDGTANAACAAGFSCAPYTGLFDRGGGPAVAGACMPACNPLTQMVIGGGACPRGDGCYTITSAITTIAVCAQPGAPTHGQPITGEPVANACAPGHLPRLRAPGVNSWECGAVCNPAEVTSTTNMASEGGVAPFTCESKGASPPDSATQGESCRHFWAREPFAERSPFSNTLGFCWKHAIYQFDSNGDGTPDMPFPRCVTLTAGDVVPPIGAPPHNDARYFWCLGQDDPPGPAVPTFAAPLGRLGSFR